MNQRTSENTVSDGLARTIGRMVEDASRNYHGGTVKLELVKGDPDFIVELYRHFDKRAAKRAITHVWPVWMNIKLGTHKEVADLNKGILDANDGIGNCGDDILKRIKVANELTNIELFRATVAEIGFPNGGTWKQIRVKLAEFGFGNCPAEVGPQLRIQYIDQPNNEWLWVVMEPIIDSFDNLLVFLVGCGSGDCWLYGCDGHPDHVFDVADVLVFCRK